MATAKQPIPGTTIFDGDQAQKGYALNKMLHVLQRRRQPRGVHAG
jgi:hypothetical protein